MVGGSLTSLNTCEADFLQAIKNVVCVVQGHPAQLDVGPCGDVQAALLAVLPHALPQKPGLL